MSSDWQGSGGDMRLAWTDKWDVSRGRLPGGNPFLPLNMSCMSIYIIVV